MPGFSTGFSTDGTGEKLLPFPSGGGSTTDTDDQGAVEVPYDNGGSGLTSTDVQNAIDELAAQIALISDGGATSSGSVAISSVRVKKAADQTAANYATAPAIVSWDAEVFDDDGWHDNAVDNSRLTVPAGITRAEFDCVIFLTSGTADRSTSIHLFKNGVDFAKLQRNVELGQVDAALGGTSGPLDVTAGDYFEIQFAYEADTSITIEEETSFFAAKGWS